MRTCRPFRVALLFLLFGASHWASALELTIQHKADHPSGDRGFALSLAHRSIALCGGKLLIATKEGQRELRATIPDEAALRLQFATSDEVATTAN